MISLERNYKPYEHVVKSDFEYSSQITGLQHNIEGVLLGRGGIGPCPKTITSLYNAASYLEVPLYLIKEHAPQFRYDRHIPEYQLPNVVPYQDFQMNLDRGLRDVFLADSILSEMDTSKPFSIQTVIHSGRGIYIAILERNYPLVDGKYQFIGNAGFGKLTVGARPLDYNFRHIVKDVEDFRIDIDTNIDNAIHV